MRRGPKLYQRAKTLSDSDKVRLTNLGLINFLLMEEE